MEKTSKIQIRNHIQKIKKPIIQICAFKEKGKEKMREDHNLVANGRFQAWWPLK
jgi:hypothetical protein